MTKNCPVCNTDEFVNYVTGSHAEGRPTIVEGEKQYVPGDCISHEHYECDKCGGCFDVSYEISNGRTTYLRINYKGERPKNEGSHTRA